LFDFNAIVFILQTVQDFVPSSKTFSHWPSLGSTTVSKRIKDKWTTKKWTRLSQQDRKKDVASSAESVHKEILQKPMEARCRL
jgi:hypothetical protein